jgi:hypothetical protein
MSRSNWLAVGGTLLVLALGIPALLLQRSHHSVLRLEIAAAREERAELEKLRAATARLQSQQLSPDALAKLRADHAALARLRAEIDTLKDQLRRQLTTASFPLPAGMTPVENLTDAGRASPRAAAESFLRWRDLSNVEALAKSMRLEGDARHKVEEVWKNLPQESRTKYPTPEHLVALLQAAAAPVRAIEIINESRLGADTMSVGVRLQFENGKIGTQQLDFRRTDDGWLWSTSPAVVEKMLPLITGLAKQNVRPAPK